MSFGNDTALGYDLFPYYSYNPQGKTEGWCCGFGMIWGCNLGSSLSEPLPEVMLMAKLTFRNTMLASRPANL